MFARTASRRYFKSNKHLSMTNPARRWVLHQVFGGLLLTWMGIVTASFAQAKYAPHGEERFAGSFVEMFMTWLPHSFMARTYAELIDNEFLPEAAQGYLIRYYGGTEEDVARYKNLPAYFTRTFDEGERPVDRQAYYVAPCDGTVLTCVEMTAEDRANVVQVKGHHYPCDTLFRTRAGLCPRGYKRYTAVIQLERDDVHRVHSPTEYDVAYSTQIPGTLLPTSVASSRWLPQLYLTNERVALFGKPIWGRADKQGREPQIGLALVGGLCKGKIKMDFDERVVTNTEAKLMAAIRRTYNNCRLNRAAPLGHFEIGSAVVMMFDSPYPALLEPGQRIKMGQPIVATNRDDPVAAAAAIASA